MLSLFRLGLVYRATRAEKKHHFLKTKSYHFKLILSSKLGVVTTTAAPAVNQFFLIVSVTTVNAFASYFGSCVID